MNNKPYFSIIVPVYKAEKYLDQCVQSILSQDMNDYEIILVDDGSPDGSPQKCDKYSDTYNFIKTVHQSNAGSSAARNKGISLARGNYIIFVDSDDFWCANDALSSIKKRLVQSKADILIFGIKKYYQDNNTFSNEILPDGHVNDLSRTNMMKQMMEKNIYIAAVWDKVIKKSFITNNKISFVENQVGEDIEWCAKILIGNPKIVVLEKCIYAYRQQNKDSITANIGKKNIECVADIILRYTENTKNIFILNFFSEQYVLWLTISNFVKSKDIKEVLKQMKSRWYLLNYNWYPYVKRVNKLKILGFNLIRRLLFIYKKIKKWQRM